MEYLFYYMTQATNKEWLNANKAQNLPLTA